MVFFRFITSILNISIDQTNNFLKQPNNRSSSALTLKTLKNVQKDVVYSSSERLIFKLGF